MTAGGGGVHRMRKPTSYLSLHDVPLDLADDGECDHSCRRDVGLCCSDEPLDKVMSYIPALDDALLEALGIDCSAPAPGGRDRDDGAEDMDVDVVVREVESALGTDAGWETSARDLSGGGVPELAATVPGGGPGTCTATTGFVSKKGAPSLPARALSCGTPTTSITPSYRGLPTPFWETESPETPEPVSPFQACAVPRKQRRRPVAVRERPWSLGFPSVLLPAAFHDNSHVDNNGNDGNVGHLSYNGGGRRRAVAQRRNRQQQRTCGHCHTSETPQWRAGPDGPGTLCNACGIRYKMGNNKLLLEYRPSTSPSFRSDEHSNRHRKVVKLREKKEKAMKADGSSGAADA